MEKKLFIKGKLTILLCFILCFALLLSGCSLFPLDTVKYLNQKVATIEYTSTSGDKNMITITKKDLINAYQNYSSTLSEYGLSGEDAFDQLVQMLINKEVILNEAEKLIEKGDIVVSNATLNQLWTETYDALIDNLADFEQQVIDAWDLKVPAELEENDDETTLTTYTPYQKTAEIVYVDGEYKIKTLSDIEDENVELIYTQGQEIKSINNAVKERIGDSTILKEALKRYTTTLKNNEEGQNLSTDDESVFQREIERIYTNVKENKYVELYNNYYENKTGYSIISVSQVLDYITQKTIASYTKYQIDPDSYDDDILNSREEMWYVMDNNYFYVTHILISFTDEQKEDITNLETMYQSGAITYQDYINGKNLIANSAVVKENGEATSLTPTQLRENLINDLKGLDDNGKAEVLKDYIYAYSGDDGNKNKTYEYIVGTENSSMVDEFNEASRELYNNGKGSFGDVSGLVVTEYGVHIVCYLQPVTNPFTITNVNNFNLVTRDADELAENINIITSTKLSPFYDRTLFDFAYDKLVTDNFSKFESLNVEVLKQGLDIKIYNNNYKDLWENQ